MNSLNLHNPTSDLYSIQFNHVFTGYGSKLILHDVSLQIEKGTIVSVIGNSGAGKSTGIRCMTGQITPKSGKAFTSGIDVENSEQVQSQIGYIPQLEHDSLYYNFSPIQNALFFGRNYGLSDTFIKSRCKELMEILGLGNKEYFNKKVKHLSGGEKKRVSIMIGLISNPEILFLDEPTTGLDPHLRIEVLNFLHEINERYKTTIILVSHDLECVDYSTKVIIFNHGALVDEGDPRRLIFSLPNHGKSHDVKFKSIDIIQYDKIEEMGKQVYFIHVGRNRYKFLPENQTKWNDVLNQFRSWGLKFDEPTKKDCTFLDYFRIMSKYQYSKRTALIKKHAKSILLK